LIGLIEINPEAHPSRHVAKFADMSLYDYSTLLIEGSDSKFSISPLPKNPEFFLYSNLDREPLAIPPCLADYLIPFIV
jgi:hypothetical protein